MGMSSAAYVSLDPTNLDNFKNPLRLPGDDGLMGVLDASDAPVRFTAHKERVEILPGKRAELLAYHSEQDGKALVNPTFRVQKGKEFSGEFTNDLDEETTVHWHGLHVDWRMDGHPFRPVASGTTYRYSFPVQDRGGISRARNA
jgi:blue copper oxidase